MIRRLLDVLFRRPGPTDERTVKADLMTHIEEDSAAAVKRVNRLVSHSAIRAQALQAEQRFQK